MNTLRITSATLEEFSIPLSPALVVETAGKRSVFDSRNGAYVRIEAITGAGKLIVGIGEVVEPVFLPSPGASSRDMLESSLGILQAVCSGLHGSELEIAGDWLPDVQNWINRIVILGEGDCEFSINLAKFAVEQACLRIIAEWLEQPLHAIIHEYIFGNPSSLVPVRLRLNNMINPRGKKDNVADVPVCGAVKIKVGGQASDPCLDSVRVNDAVKCRMQNMKHTDSSRWLRLDANQSWTVPEALMFAGNLTQEAIDVIEYIEEPLIVNDSRDLTENLTNLLESEQWRNIPIALDESLLLPGIDAILPDHPELSLVMKPFIHGFSDFAQRMSSTHSKRITISCTFETGIGLSFLASLAAAVNPEGTHGISSLPSMVDRDDQTRQFQSLLMHSPGVGSYIDLPCKLSVSDS